MTRFAPILSAVLAAFFFIIPGLPSPAHAQAESASIRGSIIDPTGAVVPGAMVRLIDVDRGYQTEVATGNGGLYTFASVPYDNQVEMAWAASLVLVLIVLAFNLIGQRISGTEQR